MRITTRKLGKMQNVTNTERVPAARLVRRLSVLSATVAWVLFLATAPASSKQVYDYVYSGTYFDGTGSQNGTFSSTVGELAYDKDSGKMLVAVNAETGYLTQFTAAGVPAPFSGPGTTDTLTMDGGLYYGGVIAIDESTGPTAGDIYVADHYEGSIYKYHPDGTEFPGWDDQLNVFTTNNLCGFAIDPLGRPWIADEGGVFRQIRPDGTEISINGHVAGEEIAPYPYFAKGDDKKVFAPCDAKFDGEGSAYGLKGQNYGRPVKFTAATGEEAYELNQLDGGGNQYLTIDGANKDVFVLRDNTVRQYDKQGAFLGEFGAPDPGHSFLGLQEAGGVAVDPTTHDVWVSNHRNYGGGVRHVEKFIRSAPITVPTATVIEPKYAGASGTLQGKLNPDGIATTDCHFEWGTNQEMTKTVACAEGPVQAGSSDITVTANVNGLSPGTAYYYRLSSKNANERVSKSGTKRFLAQVEPGLGVVLVENVNTDGARLSAFIEPNGGDASYHFEYGVAGQGFEQSSTEVHAARLLTPETGKSLITGLMPGTKYEFRAVVTNQAGVVNGGAQYFTTYLADPGVDPCPNALARQQTEASLLSDCRAYELVSARDAGGFDVESDLVAGQAPLTAYPRATDRLLYSLHAGVIPGIAGSPTNLGLDPYIARRGSTGWSTDYVGLPSDAMEDPGAFGSPLLGADPSLSEFAFGGASICNPCFEDGSSNIPLRLSNGELTKGMAGTLNPAANPSQKVVKPFSDDGSHLAFGSTSNFETAGDPGGSIYDRDLSGGTTQVVSTLPGGETMTGGEVAELDISSDGTHILVGKRISTDSKGNEYWHLYMHVGNSPNSVDLTPSTTTGVLYAGMSSAGTKVFYSTKDKLIPGDTDNSADVYEAEVSGGPAALSLVSVNGASPSNSDACNPPGFPTWNTVSGEGKCNAVVFAGGAGVASNGTIYFLSPELLAGPSNGTVDQPNVYVLRPGEEPQFVATIDSSIGKLPPPVEHPVANPALVSGLIAPESMTVDQSNGDVYVVDKEQGALLRFDSTGLAKNFTAGPGTGTNKITGVTAPGFPIAGIAGVAVDNAPGSPFNGDIYVTKFFGGVDVYAPTGASLGSITGIGSFGPCGVAIDQATGAVYAAAVDFPGLSKTQIFRFVPKVGTTPPITNANYEASSVKKAGVMLCQLAADKLGHVFASGGSAYRFNSSEFAPAPPTVAGTFIGSPATAVATDPANDDLYVNEGGQIARYNSLAKLVQKFGSGKISSSSGVAINKETKHVYAPSGTKIVEFGTQPAPFSPISNPAVVHGVQQSGVHSYPDFQVSPDGRFAVFSSVLPLTGFLTSGHTEIYRSDAETETLQCPSCATSESNPATDTTLPRYGLALTDDGRVFFTTKESFALRDTNEKLDAYEWSNGKQQLISTGIGPHDSGLVTVSADGTDAFFFTRDKLVPEDANGLAIRIYDARAGGGYILDPPSHLCAASDECHGAGTQPPPAPEVRTASGAGQQSPEKTCRKGRVKRHGKCVKRHKSHHSKRHATRRHG